MKHVCYQVWHLFSQFIKFNALRERVCRLDLF